MAKSSSSKGSYYKIKTKNYLEGKGYVVEYLERLQRIYTKGKVIFIKKDILGADGIAVNDSECILWNSNLGKANIAAHIKIMLSYPQGGIKHWLIIWTPRISDPDVLDIDAIREAGADD